MKPRSHLGRLALVVPFLLRLTAGANDALADEPRADNVTHVSVSSDWDGTVLIRHGGTALGVGYAAGRRVTMTTAYLERVCRVPCAADVPTESNYVVDAPGMNAAGFELPPGAKGADVRVKGASQWPLTLSSTAATLGLVASLTGGIFWGVGANTGTDGVDALASSGRTITFIGLGTLAAGVVGLILLPRTQVTIQPTAGTDPSPTPAKVQQQTAAVQLTPSGLVF